MSIKKSVYFVYDFAVNGGAVGTIPMKAFLPANSMACDVWVKADASPTCAGGTATMQVVVGTQPVTSAAELFSDWPSIGTGKNMQFAAVVGVTAAGLNPAIVTGIAGTPGEFIATAGQVGFKIAGEALTAGKFTIIVEYYQL